MIMHAKDALNLEKINIFWYFKIFLILDSLTEIMEKNFI